MNKLVILMVVAIIIIVLIAIMYSQKLPSNSSSIKPNSTSASTTSKPVATTIQSNTVSTTAQSNTVSTTMPSTNTANSLNYSFISDINIEFIYTGPATNSSNVSCNYYNNTIPYTFNNYEKSKASFSINLTISTSSSCGLTIRNMSSLTNGFKVFSTNPVLPYYIPGHNSQALMQINLTTPAYNFSGPVSIIIHEV